MEQVIVVPLPYHTPVNIQDFEAHRQRWQWRRNW
jgi:hypothetical protein